MSCKSEPRCRRCGKSGHYARDCSDNKNTKVNSVTASNEKPTNPSKSTYTRSRSPAKGRGKSSRESNIRCRTCGKIGHISPNCPEVIRRKRSSTTPFKSKKFKTVTANKIDISDGEEEEYSEINESDIDEELQNFLDEQTENINVISLSKKIPSDAETDEANPEEKLRETKVELREAKCELRIANCEVKNAEDELKSVEDDLRSAEEELNGVEEDLKGIELNLRRVGEEQEKM